MPNATLVLDRSTSSQTAALYDGEALVAEVALSSTWCIDVINLLGGGVPERIVVGIGPGSFAGIRSTLAFAQGCTLGANVELRGIVSPAAFAREGETVAVIGDARRGKFWVALFDAFKPAREIFQVAEPDLPAAIPAEASVVSPDASRIGATLASLFPSRYAAAPELKASDLHRAFTANPSLLVPEPLPVYLNPAVRFD